jgi:phage/plasmid-like protein (TIGR03299 family)
MHALEIGSKGQVAFATREVPAWHNLGTVFAQDEHVTTSDMLDKAHLSGWNVRLESAGAVFNCLGEYDMNDDRFAVVRTHPFTARNHIIGWVGGRYKVVQNEELFLLADGILAGGGQWETAGSISDGARIFGSLSIDRQIVVGAGEADDKTDLYLMVTSSHDGSTAVTGGITPVRVVCKNTLDYALPGITQKFKFRHTQTVEGRMAQAREALGLTFKYADAFEAEANKLFETAVTKNEFDKLIEAAYPRPDKDSKGSFKKWDTKRDLLMGIFTDTADGPKTTGAIGGTAWGALNALTERIDWYRMPRGGNVDNLFEDASGFGTVVSTEKARLHKLVVAMAA